MRTNIFLLNILIILSFSTTSWSQGWERLFPEYSNIQPHAAKRVIPASDGGFHILTSNAYVAAAGNGFSLIKVDADGVIQNSETFANNIQRVGIDMIMTANQELVIVSRENVVPNDFDSNIIFLRVDQNYNIISESTIDILGDIESPRDIIESPDGTFWLTGRGGEFPFTSFIQKLDAQGNTIGATGFDGFNDNYAQKILPHGNGGATVFCYKQNTTFINQYDSNGLLINQVTYTGNDDFILPNDAINTSDGNIIITGSAWGNGSSRAVMLKIDNSGNQLWRKEIPTSDFLAITSVKEKVGGNGYRLLVREQVFQSLSIQHTGIIDTDIQGEPIWQKSYAVNYFNHASDFQILPDNSMIIAAERHQTHLNPFQNSNVVPYVIRTDALGNTLRSGVSGKVANDDTDDCVEEGIDQSVGRSVSAFQNGFSVGNAIVDSSGNYTIEAPPGTYKLVFDLPNFLWSSCQDSIDIVIPNTDTLENQNFVIAYNNEPMDDISGYLFEDVDNDCIRDSFETEGFAGWLVTLDLYEDGNSVLLIDTTDENGFYSFDDLEGFTTGAQALISAPFGPTGTGLNCGFPCWQEYDIGPFTETSFTFNNGVTCDTLPFCPIMSVSIATDEIRPCINEQYVIQYCNIGGFTAQDAYLEVTIDPALEVYWSSIPWDAQVGNVFTFELGNLFANECGTIRMNFNAPCEDSLGTTYCSEVYAFPDSTCVTAGPEWDGSEIELSVECLADSVRFKIQNIGVGDMTSELEYIVIEDNVLLGMDPNPFQLPSTQSMEVTFPANGSFYHMESMQPPGFPGLSTPITWIEGCGQTGNISLGMVNQYPLGDEDTWQDIFCIESVGSFDPNDKNGFPRGLGDQHFIDQNQDLEYIIRFQNTGTADALYVEIRDTIATQHLDITSLRVGASSHDYTWDIQGNGVIVFKFENINLPDETTDPEGSKGFVQFRIKQPLDLPIGTMIHNTAAIYFDNNAPIITNQTLHTIGEDYLMTWTREISKDQLKEVVLFPNPVTDWTYIEVKGIEAQQALELQVYDVIGNQVKVLSFENKSTINILEQSSPGTYFYKIYQSNQVIGVGKIIKI